MPIPVWTATARPTLFSGPISPPHIPVGCIAWFELLDRRQTVKIAESLRGGMAVPSGTRFEMANYDALPARPLIQDPRLARRIGEMFQNAAGFFLPPQ